MSELYLERVISMRRLSRPAAIAAAVGHKDEARVWYQRYLALWAKADPQAAPVLDRVRKALAALTT